MLDLRISKLNKKVYTLLGKKVLLSRLLAEEACKDVENDNTIKYIIYCDKPTMIYSQKWYRYIFVYQLRIFLTKKAVRNLMCGFFIWDQRIIAEKELL